MRISPRWARRCGWNTRPSSANGFLLQIDAPDLALERHVSYQDQPVGAFVDFVERVVAVINHALAQHPARKGAAARLLGQLRRAARLRR